MSASRFTASLARIALMVALITLGAGSTPPAPAEAQTLDPNLWVTNGTVYAVASVGDTLYAGGTFTEVGKATGGAAAFDPATGAIPGSFPSVLGQVHTIISDGAGGYYVGGQFTHVGGQPRENIAHIASDLSVSPWNPGANNEVYALALNPNGNLSVGGSFSQLGGQARTRYGEVQPNGTVAGIFPVFNGTVRAIVFSGTDMYVGGDFTNISGIAKSRVAKISAGTLQLGWNANASGPVHVLRIVNHFEFGEGVVTTLLVGGSFSSIGGQLRNNAAKLDVVTATARPWNPNLNGPVYAFGEVSTDYFIGGNFTSAGGVGCTNVVSVTDQSGAASAGWVPSVNGEVKAILNRGNSVLIGGRFSSAGGAARRGLAALNYFNPGGALAWDPHPNHDVETLLDAGTYILAGGLFTAANNVTRNRLAMFLRSTGAPTGWNPNADNEVRAITLDASTSGIRSVIVGGYFGNVGGATRTRLAALSPTTGSATAWNPTVTGGDGSVRTFCLTGGTLYVGGFFTSLSGQSRIGAGAYTVSTGALTTWNPNAGASGMVLALTATATKVFLGGAFSSVGGQARSNLACVDRNLGAVLPWAASANDYVFDLALGFGNVYAGGIFQTVNGGQPRAFTASFDTTAGALNSWNPNPDSYVYGIAATESRIVLGGAFDLLLGLDRQGIVGVDPFVGQPDDLNPDIEGSVFSIDIAHDRLFAGGSFQDVKSLARPNLALFDEIIPPICPGGPLASPTAFEPRTLATGDFDGDGIRDLVLCHATNPQMFSTMRGLGSGGVGTGVFQLHGAGFVTGTAKAAVAADFDVDGLDDVAVSVSNGLGSGSVFVFHNLGGGQFDTPLQIPLLGASDGLAAGDVTNDGILDLAVCLSDSAGQYDRGGIQLLRGDGTNGVWNGGFVSAWKQPQVIPTSARRVILQDFNADGSLDMAYSGWAPGAYVILKLAPGGTLVRFEYAATGFVAQESGVGIATGDLDGDARADFVITSRRRVTTRLRTTNDDPNSFFFVVPVNSNLSSTPREIALLDYDFDGKLDLVCGMDSLSQVEVYPGLGDGGFGPSPTVIGTLNTYGLALGDFETNGSLDVVVSQPGCDRVLTISQSGTSPLVLDLDLTAPNGGEVWAQLPFAQGTSAVAPVGTAETALSGVASTTDAEILAIATSSLAPDAGPGIPVVASTQFVTWNKGNGIASVDVDVSRDGGDSWQPIGRNQPGTSLRWIVTPPASATALVRVCDSNVASRNDASDAWFQIPANTVDVDPSAGLPRVAAIWMLGANPVRGGGAIAFRLDVPRTADVRVDVYDVAGRHVHTVARKAFAPGRYDLAWNASGAAGARASGPRAGVYFVRAVVGEARTLGKFVVLE